MASENNLLTETRKKKQSEGQGSGCLASCLAIPAGFDVYDEGLTSEPPKLFQSLGPICIDSCARGTRL